MNPARILVVDDDPISRALFVGLLRQCGAEVVVADGVASADAALAQTVFDLVVSDVHMPGNDRLEWVEAALRRPDFPPLVLFTGNPALDSAILAANLPVAGYLTKPPRLAELSVLLPRLINHRRRCADLRHCAGEIATLAAHPGLPEGLAGQLGRLADGLQTAALSSPRSAGDPWRTAIAETIAVLEGTKHSFRSRALGELRRRLEHVLNAPAA